MSLRTPIVSTLRLSRGLSACVGIADALQNYGGDLSIVLADTVSRQQCQGVDIDDEINGDANWRVRYAERRLQTLEPVLGVTGVTTCMKPLFVAVM